jgi:SMI1/KNR4 family protein SUKH-1
MSTNVDWIDFFDESNYFTGPPLTEEMIRATETKLGYKLPESYLQLLRNKNGGSPKRKCFPTGKPDWADDHVEVSGICGIGGTWGIDSEQRGSRYMIREWGYPDVGIFIGQTPSAGHDGVMLDYTECGRNGEPRVIHVDVEGDEPQIQILAQNLETFLRGLVDCGPFHERMDAAM